MSRGIFGIMENITEIVCPNCGEKLPGDSVFCAKCGTRLNEDAQQEVQGVEQVAKPTGFFAKYKKIRELQLLRLL